jgi:hypothetical protein
VGDHWWTDYFNTAGTTGYAGGLQVDAAVGNDVAVLKLAADLKTYLTERVHHLTHGRRQAWVIGLELRHQIGEALFEIDMLCAVLLTGLLQSGADLIRQVVQVLPRLVSQCAGVSDLCAQAFEELPKVVLRHR